MSACTGAWSLAQLLPVTPTYSTQIFPSPAAWCWSGDRRCYSRAENIQTGRFPFVLGPVPTALPHSLLGSEGVWKMLELGLGIKTQ